MLRRVAGLTLVLLTLGLSAAGAPAVDVHYIANEGFLLTAGQHKVVIDGIFGDDRISWCHVPDAATRKQLGAAEPPFDAIDVVLVTHQHLDHFDPALTLGHLGNNADAVVIAPSQAVARLREHSSWDAAFAPRIHEIDLQLFASTTVELGGIRVTATRLRHGRYMVDDPETGKKRNRHENVENLAYHVEFGGIRILHTGDAFLDQNPELFADHGFAEGPLDILFFEGWTPASLDLVREHLKPRHVVGMHLQPDPERIDATREFLEGELSAVTLFDTPGQHRRIDP